eukprot:4641150-Pyramimonas_sp.AAC.1
MVIVRLPSSTADATAMLHNPPVSSARGLQFWRPRSTLRRRGILGDVHVALVVALALAGLV